MVTSRERLLGASIDGSQIVVGCASTALKEINEEPEGWTFRANKNKSKRITPSSPADCQQCLFGSGEQLSIATAT